MSSPLKYRPEIDGLRTIAVLAVIIYHLNPKHLVGGFLGVDVFFVISGFLITKIIVNQVQEGSFTFKNFWLRRFKRLYPALMVTVLFTLIGGLIILPHPERGQLIFQSLGALFSFSNILLWQSTGGYWDSSSENIALLHTWSLSLEEQFYIFLPLLLVLVHRWKKGGVAFLLMILLLGSALASVLYTKQDPNGAFYLLPTRMWELLFGGMLSIQWGGTSTFKKVFDSKIITNLLHLLAVALIVWSFINIEHNEHFPSLYPLVPCLGALLLIIHTPQTTLVKRFLMNPVVVYVGKISYSLYLWHWPVIVFSKYLGYSVYASIPFFVIMSILSYHWVETPTRHAKRVSFKWLASGALALGTLLLTFKAYPKPLISPDFGNMHDPITYTYGREYDQTNLINNPYDLSQLDHEKKPLIVVIGSSHGMHYCRPFQEFAQANNINFISLSMSGIGMITVPEAGFSLYRNKFDTGEIRDKRNRYLAELQPDLVVLGGRWELETSKKRAAVLAQEINKVLPLTKNLLIMGQVPRADLPEEYANDIRKYLIASSTRGERPEIRYVEQVVSGNNKVRELINSLTSDKVSFIDPHSLLSKDDKYIRYIVDGDFLYRDDDHINELGARYVFDQLVRTYIEKVFESHLKK